MAQTAPGFHRLRSAVTATILSLAGGGAISGCAAHAPPDTQLRAEQLEDRIRITAGGELVTEYRYADDQKYPYFFPVVGPRTGESVTTESSEPYPHHHSLFFGSDYVNGGNYWQDELSRGRIVAEETRIVRASGSEVEFTQTSLWSRPGAPAPFRDERVIRISAPSDDVRLIDFDITLTPLIDVRIEKTNHSLFAARMVPALSVDSGGTLVNSRGGRSAEGTFGQAAEWADFYGARGGVVEGLAILNHPQNRWTPPPWFTRDYGFFSPTPFNWFEEGHLDLPAGEPLRLRYRVVVHGGTTDEARIAELYADYAQ
jgi:hypothetical protein